MIDMVGHNPQYQRTNAMWIANCHNAIRSGDRQTERTYTLETGSDRCINPTFASIDFFPNNQRDHFRIDRRGWLTASRY